MIAPACEVDASHIDTVPSVTENDPLYLRDAFGLPLCWVAESWNSVRRTILSHGHAHIVRLSIIPQRNTAFGHLLTIQCDSANAATDAFRIPNLDPID